MSLWETAFIALLTVIVLAQHAVIWWLIRMAKEAQKIAMETMTQADVLNMIDAIQTRETDR